MTDRLMGFAFRKKGVETPPSLVNIYKELEDDMGCYIPNNGNLENGQSRACFF